MTKERESLEKIVTGLKKGVENEIIIKTQEKTIKKQEEEIAGLKRKVKFYGILKKVGKGLGYTLASPIILVWKGVEAVRDSGVVGWMDYNKGSIAKLVVVLGMAGGGLYLGTYIASRDETKTKERIEGMYASFLETANQKDEKLLREYFVCEEDKKGDNFNFMEVMMGRVLEGGSYLKKFEVKEYPEINEDSRKVPSEYKVKVEADLVSNKNKRPEKMAGWAPTYCGEKCEFRIKKRNLRLCPSYARKYGR